VCWNPFIDELLKERQMAALTIKVFLLVLAIAIACNSNNVAVALPAVYGQQGSYPVATTVLTVQKSEGLGIFQCTVYYPTNSGAGGGRCNDIASCYLQSVSLAGQDVPVASGGGGFPLVAFGLNTFISGQEVYGSTMRHIASHGFVVAATNSRYIQPAAEAVEMVDCINELEKMQTAAGSKFHQKLNLGVGVGVLGYSQGGAASLDTAARLGSRCAGCITQHAQPSMMASQIKCPVFLHSGDADSLTGIMKAMIWSGVKTPKVFAIMRGAHHLTPVPPSPWDPWSLAWLMLYQKGDSQAGRYIWGGPEVVGSLRSLGMSGQMSEVLFNPTVPWSNPYTQYGVKVVSNEGGAYTVLPPTTQTTQQQQQADVYSNPATSGGGGIGSIFGMPSGSMGSMFGSSGASSSSSPFSFLQSFLGRYTSMTPAPTPAPSPSMAPQPQAGMTNTLSNTAGSLNGVVNIPTQEEETSLQVDALVRNDNQMDETFGVSYKEEEQQYTWSPIRPIRRVDPQPMRTQIQKETLSVSVQRPTMEALNNNNLNKFQQQQQQQEEDVTVQKKMHDKHVKDLSDTLGGPYCESSADCCFPGECTLITGTAVSYATTNMCSLPAGGLGKLASDPTCRRGSGLNPVTTGPSGESHSRSQGTGLNQFALIPKPTAPSSSPSTSDHGSYQGILQIPQTTSSSLNQRIMEQEGPSLILVSCDDTVMTLRVSGPSAAGSTIVVLGSIYVPKPDHVDQLILLSNSECPIIDVNIKMPKQHLSKQFLKTAIVKKRPVGQQTLVTLDNMDGDTCSDFVYQAVDVSRCIAGPVLDLR
jgi:hypothetical protein